MTKKNIPNISITDVQRDQSHNHNINVPNFSLMSSIPKTQFQIPTFFNKTITSTRKRKIKTYTCICLPKQIQIKTILVI